MYFKYKIDLGYKIFNIMPKRKRDETKKTAVEIAAHLDFTKISDGKTFYKEVCRYFAESCGKSRLRTQNRDEDWWRNGKNRVEHPYNSTPAAKKVRSTERKWLRLRNVQRGEDGRHT